MRWCPYPKGKHPLSPSDSFPYQGERIFWISMYHLLRRGCQISGNAFFLAFPLWGEGQEEGPQYLHGHISDNGTFDRRIIPLSLSNSSSCKREQISWFRTQRLLQHTCQIPGKAFSYSPIGRLLPQPVLTEIPSARWSCFYLLPHFKAVGLPFGNDGIDKRCTFTPPMPSCQLLQSGR